MRPALKNKKLTQGTIMKPSKAVPMNPISAMDFSPLEQLHSLQLARLRDMVELAYANVPLFKARLDERGIKPDDI